MEKPFDFLFDYYRNEIKRGALDELVQKVFGFSFSAWNDLGYDSGDYTPFSYFEGGAAIANVSASPMHLVSNGEPREAIQLGTIASLPDYRGRGLIRALMETAHDHWEADDNLFFLFANESVQDFYQRFGYRRVLEFEFFSPAPQFSKAKMAARNLNLADAGDRELLCGLLENRAPVSSSLGVVRHTWLALFHAAVRYSKHLAYIEPLNIVVVSVFKNRVLYLVDVIGAEIPPLLEIYPYIGSDEVERIVYQFTPDSLEAPDLTFKPSKDSILFVKGDFELEDRVFRFPETSQA